MARGKCRAMRSVHEEDPAGKRERIRGTLSYALLLHLPAKGWRGGAAGRSAHGSAYGRAKRLARPGKRLGRACPRHRPHPSQARRDRIVPAPAPPRRRHRRHRARVPPTRVRRTSSGAVRNRPWKAAAPAASRDAGALLRVGEHGIGDGRMAGGQHAARLVLERGIDARRHLALIGLRRQVLGLGQRRTAPCARRRCAEPPRPARAASSGASARASSDLPVPDSPPTATSCGLRRRDQRLRQREIVARALLGLARASLAQPGARGGDLGADGGAHRQEQRQRGQRVEIVGPARLGEIAVEHDIGRARASRARSGP